MNRKSDGVAPMAIGGQAVIEGVMMRAPGVVATAVRRADGSISVRTEAHRSVAERFPLLKLPVFRGAVGLIEMMIIGIRTLNYSAEISLQDLGGKEPGTTSTLRLGLTVGVALVAGIGLFFALPLALTSFLLPVEQQPFLFNTAAGGVRVVLLLGYLAVIAMMKDIRRLFEYHGAEHKAVFAFERGGPLDVTSAAAQSRFHPRCGTSFLLIVMLSAIVLFGVVDTLLILRFGEITLLTRLMTHLPLIPLVGGLSYEVIRLSAKHSATLAGRIVAAPGLWLQRITTREPDNGQIDVALAALRAAVGGAPSPIPVPAGAGTPAA